MAACDLSLHIKSPPETVFEVFTDLEHASERIPAIKSLEVVTDGPVGQGTRFRETRVMFGKEATEEMEITRFEPPRSYAVTCGSCGALFETTFTFTPENGGTRVDQHTSSRAVSFGAKLMSPLSFLMMGAMKKMMLKDMEALKDHCEAQGAVATTV